MIKRKTFFDDFHMFWDDFIRIVNRGPSAW